MPFSCALVWLVGSDVGTDRCDLFWENLPKHGTLINPTESVMPEDHYNL